MKRYINLSMSPANMAENEAGEWVEYSDVKELEKQNKEMLFQLKDVEIFVRTKEKMNPTGIKIFNDLIQKIEGDQNA